MTERKGTKQKLLRAALQLFGDRGYEAVTVAQIADAVGCTAPALYKHYAGKQELFEAILEESRIGWQASMQRVLFDLSDEEARKKIANLTEEEQIDLAQQLLLHPLHDEMARAFRRLMEVEQFHFPALAEAYNQRYVDFPYQQQTEMFRCMMEEGRMQQGDPEMLSICYLSPIIVFIGMCDRAPERETEALEKIAAHVRDFNRAYMVRNEEK